MAFQTPISIRDALDNISSSRYLLPAIQRDFVWDHWKIEWLFDSLMREYPISSFLFWEVRGETKKSYKFYRFLKDFREDFHTESQEVDVNEDFTAVLDGQQRLTSLYIGLKGSFAYRTPYSRKVDDEKNRPTRLLYVNISQKFDEKDEEDGRVYKFSFLANIETEKRDLYVKKIKDREETWFRVGKILDFSKPRDLSNFIKSNDIPEVGDDILQQLFKIVFMDKHINYFLEKSTDLDKTLNIFIRINSGGQPLNFSDLIMSIAVAHWKDKDAKNEIPRLINDVNAIGFTINKDFIFKTFLYLYNTDIRFKVTNFRQNNAKKLEEEWENIRDAIKQTFRLIASFGFNDYTLTSKNAVIPIIFYLYHRKIYSTFKDAVGYDTDRNAIRQWLHIVLIKRVFGSNSDALLSLIRQAFLPDKSDTPLSDPVEETQGDAFAETGEGESYSAKFTISKGLAAFPVKIISEKIKSSLSVGDDVIDDLLHTQKDDRYAFSILALLFPNMDYKNNNFHKDHLHPYSAFISFDINAHSLAPQDRDYFTSPAWYNSIVNLQMLDANVNEQKQHTSLSTWIESKSELLGEIEARKRALIPADTSLLFEDFAQFAEKRKSLLAKQLKVALGS